MLSPLNGVVAELILTSIGYLFLCNALIDLWQHHAETSKNRFRRREDIDKRPGTGKAEMGLLPRMVSYHLHIAHPQGIFTSPTRLTPGRFLRGILLASLVTAIAAGAVLSRHLNSNEEAKIIADLIKASYILSLGTCASGYTICVAHPFRSRHRPHRSHPAGHPRQETPLVTQDRAHVRVRGTLDHRRDLPRGESPFPVSCPDYPLCPLAC